MIARLFIIGALASAATAPAADEPFGVLDIVLGASYVRLERELDFRDLGAALAQTRSGKLDLGKRGEIVGEVERGKALLRTGGAHGAC